MISTTGYGYVLMLILTESPFDPPLHSTLFYSTLLYWNEELLKPRPRPWDYFIESGDNYMKGSFLWALCFKELEIKLNSDCGLIIFKWDEILNKFFGLNQVSIIVLSFKSENFDFLKY